MFNLFPSNICGALSLTDGTAYKTIRLLSPLIWLHPRLDPLDLAPSTFFLRQKKATHCYYAEMLNSPLWKIFILAKAMAPGNQTRIQTI